jgi:nucleotidyltransferase/DNA polymerase involved in DNA repair
MSSWVLHVDLDQFIAAVEVLRRPELRGRPVVVGGDGDPTKRGVVSTASYEAREKGVHSGVPLRTAARRIPDAVFLPVDHPVYEAASQQVMAVLRDFAVVEVIGWDEAFLAVEADEPEDLARRIQAHVLEATGLHCTVGIGQTKLQAKMATGFGKPAGVYRLTFDTWFDVLGDRPVEVLWGIGRRTAAKLAELSIETVRDLAAADPGVVAARFGPNIGPGLVRHGQGGDRSPVVDEPWIPRSRGREHTFQTDVGDWDEVRDHLIRLVRELAADIGDDLRPTRRIIVKVRYVPFFTKEYGFTLQAPSTEVADLVAGALGALDRFTEHGPVRLLGVRFEYVKII